MDGHFAISAAGNRADQAIPRYRLSAGRQVQRGPVFERRPCLVEPAEPLQDGDPLLENGSEFRTVGAEFGGGHEFASLVTFLPFEQQIVEAMVTVGHGWSFRTTQAVS